jgi:hypothetical protein
MQMAAAAVTCARVRLAWSVFGFGATKRERLDDDDRSGRTLSGRVARPMRVAFLRGGLTSTHTQHTATKAKDIKQKKGKKP